MMLVKGNFAVCGRGRRIPHGTFQQKPMKLRSLLRIAIPLVWAATGCVRPEQELFYSATAFAEIIPGKSFTEGKLVAIQTAEQKARDQILLETMQLKFQNGKTLGDAIITDSFIRAKVYDTIRTAKIVDQTIDDKGVVSITVRLDQKPLFDILSKYSPGPAS